MKGIISFYDHRRGFGYIQKTRAEHFWFHVSSIIDGPLGLDIEGWWCEFEARPATEPDKKPVAINIKLLGEDAEGGSH